MQHILIVLLIGILLIPCVGAWAENQEEIENYTRYTNYQPQPAVPVGLMPGENHRVLVVWFSRVGNTVFEPDVDVVSTATLNSGAEGELLGNAQMVAGWIARKPARMFSRWTTIIRTGKPSDLQLP